MAILVSKGFFGNLKSFCIIFMRPTILDLEGTVSRQRSLTYRCVGPGIRLFFFGGGHLLHDHWAFGGHFRPSIRVLVGGKFANFDKKRTISVLLIDNFRLFHFKVYENLTGQQFSGNFFARALGFWRNFTLIAHSDLSLLGSHLPSFSKANHFLQLRDTTLVKFFIPSQCIS